MELINLTADTQYIKLPDGNTLILEPLLYRECFAVPGYNTTTDGDPITITGGRIMSQSDNQPNIQGVAVPLKRATYDYTEPYYLLPPPLPGIGYIVQSADGHPKRDDLYTVSSGQLWQSKTIDAPRTTKSAFAPTLAKIRRESELNTKWAEERKARLSKDESDVYAIEEYEFKANAFRTAFERLFGLIAARSSK